MQSKKKKYQKGGSKPSPPSWLDFLKSSLNPYNWGVTDYSDRKDFNIAYSDARNKGEKEFLYKGKRYNTNYDGTPEQQLRETGITNDRLRVKNAFSDRLYNTIKPSSYGSADTKQHLRNFFKNKNRFKNSREILDLHKKYFDLKFEIGMKGGEDGDAPKEDLVKLQKLEERLKELSSSDWDAYAPTFTGEDDPYSEDAWAMYLGKPQKNNTFHISKYKPSISNDKNVNYYALPNQFKDDLYETYKELGYDLSQAGDVFDEDYLPYVSDKNHSRARVLGNFKVDEGEDERGKYISYYDQYNLSPDLPIVGTKVGADAFAGKPFEIYDRIYIKDYGDGEQKRMYYTDEELSNLDVNKKNFDTLALQRELRNRGYEFSKSTKEDGILDGTWGDETKNALLDYQRGQNGKNPMKKRKYNAGGPTPNKLDDQKFYYGEFRDSILKDSGIDAPTFERYRRAVLTHEPGPGNKDPYTTIQIVTDDDGNRIKDDFDLDVGVGRGGYQFEAPSLVTAANRALRVVDEKHPYYKIFKDIQSKKIQDATQLHPDIQDILFAAQHLKIRKKEDGSYYVEPSSILSNIDTLDGATDVWYRLHNKGKDPSKKKKFKSDVSHLFELDDNKYQNGGPKPKKRKGYLLSSDDRPQTHLMRHEVIDGQWVAFPTLFQNDDGEWVNMSELADKNWFPVYEEALRRGEVYKFPNEKSAEVFAKDGSWKKDYKVGGRAKPKKALTGMEISLLTQALGSSGGGSGNSSGEPGLNMSTLIKQLGPNPGQTSTGLQPNSPQLSGIGSGDFSSAGEGGGEGDKGGVLKNAFSKIKNVNRAIGDGIRNNEGINAAGTITSEVGNAAATEGDYETAAIAGGVGDFLKSGKLFHGLAGAFTKGIAGLNRRTQIEHERRRDSERRISRNTIDPFQNYAKVGGKFPIKRTRKSILPVAKFQKGGGSFDDRLKIYFDTIVLPHYKKLGYNEEQAYRLGMQYMNDNVVGKEPPNKESDTKGPITLDPVVVKADRNKDADSNDHIYKFINYIKDDDDDISSLEKKIDDVFETKKFGDELGDVILKKLKKDGKDKVKRVAASIYMPGEKADIKVSKDGLYEYPGEKVRVPFKRAGGNITMKGINHPVLGIPDIGKPKLMMPDNVYPFPKANYVDEVPMMQEGGLDSETLDESEGIQTEKGERVLLPNMDIAEVNADKRHKDMDDYTITDILPDPSYIFSANSEQSIDLKRLKDSDEDVLGFSDGYYSEDKNVKGEDILISDVLGKKGKLNYSQAAEKIKKHYKTVMKKDGGESDDIFTKRTNRENKEARIPLLKWLIQKQEKERPDFVAEDSKEFPSGSPKRYRRGGFVRKYQTGEPEPFDWWTSPLNPNRIKREDILGPIGPAGYDNNQNIQVPGPVGPGGRVEDDNNYGLTLEDIYARLDEDDRINIENRDLSLEEYADLKRRDNLRNSTNAIARGFTLGLQDPVVDAAIERAPLINEIYRGQEPSSIRQQVNAIQSPLSNTQRNLLRSGVDPRNVVRMTAPLYNQTIRETNQLGASLAESNRELDRRKYRLLTDIANRNEVSAVDARNQTRGNLNAIRAGYGDIASDYINTRGVIDSRDVSARNKIRGDYLNNRSTSFQNRVNAEGLRINQEALQRQIDLLRRKGNSNTSSNFTNTDQNSTDNSNLDSQESRIADNGLGLILRREGNLQGLVPDGPGLAFDTRITNSGLDENPGAELGLHNPIFQLPSLDLPEITGFRPQPTLPEEGRGTNESNANTPPQNQGPANTPTGEIDYSKLPTPPPPPSDDPRFPPVDQIPFGEFPSRGVEDGPTIPNLPFIDNPGGGPLKTTDEARRRNDLLEKEQAILDNGGERRELDDGGVMVGTFNDDGSFDGIYEYEDGTVLEGKFGYDDKAGTTYLKEGTYTYQDGTVEQGKFGYDEGGGGGISYLKEGTYTFPDGRTVEIGKSSNTSPEYQTRWRWPSSEPTGNDEELKDLNSMDFEEYQQEVNNNIKELPMSIRKSIQTNPDFDFNKSMLESAVGSLVANLKRGNVENSFEEFEQLAPSGIPRQSLLDLYNQVLGEYTDQSGTEGEGTESGGQTDSGEDNEFVTNPYVQLGNSIYSARNFDTFPYSFTGALRSMRADLKQNIKNIIDENDGKITEDRLIEEVNNYIDNESLTTQDNVKRFLKNHLDAELRSNPDDIDISKEYDDFIYPDENNIPLDSQYTDNDDKVERLQSQLDSYKEELERKDTSPSRAKSLRKKVSKTQEKLNKVKSKDSEYRRAMRSQYAKELQKANSSNNLFSAYEINNILLFKLQKEGKDININNIRTELEKFINSAKDNAPSEKYLSLYEEMARNKIRKIKLRNKQ